MLFDSREPLTFTIGDHWLSAIINADETGLSDEESAQLNEWLETLPRGPHTFVCGESTEFAKDEISGLMGNCTMVTVYNF